MSQKNVINAENIFRPVHGKWRQDFEDQMRIAFILHIFGHDKQKENKIIEAVKIASGGVLDAKPYENETDELLILECGNDSSQCMDLWCLNRTLPQAIFVANGKPCFILSGAFNGAMAKCFTWFPAKEFRLTTNLKKELTFLDRSGSLVDLFKSYHNPKANGALSERLINRMKQQTLSFGPEVPLIKETVAGTQPYVRMEWFWTNDTPSDYTEERIYSTTWAAKYLFSDVKTLDELIETCDGLAEQFRDLAKTGKVSLTEDCLQDGIIHFSTRDEEVAAKFGFELEDEE